MGLNSVFMTRVGPALKISPSADLRYRYKHRCLGQYITVAAGYEKKLEPIDTLFISKYCYTFC